MVRIASALLLTLAFACATDPAEDVRTKLKLIQTGHAKRGSSILFPASELNAYAASEIPKLVPAGVTGARLELRNGGATGYARVDLLKLQHAQGVRTPWLLEKASGRSFELENPRQAR